MKDNIFKYQSVHDYLDEILSDSPSHEEIKNAKRAYWRKYNTYLKRQRRKALKHISLALSHAEYKQLSRLAKESGESIFSYVRSLSLNPVPFRIPAVTIHQLDESSLKLQDLFEEMQDEELMSNRFYVDNFSETMRRLQLQIGKLKNVLS